MASSYKHIHISFNVIISDAWYMSEFAAACPSNLLGINYEHSKGHYHILTGDLYA